MRQKRRETQAKYPGAYTAGSRAVRRHRLVNDLATTLQDRRLQQCVGLWHRRGALPWVVVHLLQSTHAADRRSILAQRGRGHDAGRGRKTETMGRHATSDRSRRRAARQPTMQFDRPTKQVQGCSRGRARARGKPPNKQIFTGNARRPEKLARAKNLAHNLGRTDGGASKTAHPAEGAAVRALTATSFTARSASASKLRHARPEGSHRSDYFQSYCIRTL